MDFWGQVWKRVWEMTFFGLKLGLDLEMRAAHPHQKFQGVPSPGSKLTKDQIINLFLTGMVSQYASAVSKNWIHNPRLHKVELFLKHKWYPGKNIR